MVPWIGNDWEAIWPQMERGSVGGVPLSVLPFNDTKSFNKIKIKNKWIKHNLKVWTTVKKINKMPRPDGVNLNGHADSWKNRIPTFRVGLWV